MKVKNIVFSGVMAAILGATGAHAAEGDQIQLISKTYADNNLQAKLTQANNAGDNVTISADGKIGVNLTNYATTSAVDTAISNAVMSDNGVIKTVIDGVQADVDALDGKVGELPTSGDYAAATIVEYINKKTTGIATNAALGELQTAVNTAKDDIDALELKVGNDTVANQITAAIADKADKATSLSGYGITDAYTKAEVDATVGTLATKDELDDVSAVADAAQTADEVSAAIDGKINGLNLGTTYAAKSIETTVQTNANDIATLKEIDHTKFAEKTTVDGIDTRLQTAEGEIDALQNATANLSDFIDSTEIQAYATTEALAGVNTTAKQGVTDAAAAKAAADAAQADADANATAIQGKVDSIGAGKAGSYIINFDADGNATYTAITIVE